MPRTEFTVDTDERTQGIDVTDRVSDAVPDEGWRHDEVDDNADAHVRATLFGEHVTVPVSDGQPGLGTWQSNLERTTSDGQPRTDNRAGRGETRRKTVALVYTPGHEPGNSLGR
jgi:hypothetical protein